MRRDSSGGGGSSARPARSAREVSLERALSKLGLATRSAARALVSQGRVAVNGRIVTDPLAPVEPERARISIDGREAAVPAPLTVLLYKPRGVVTTRSDPAGRPTVYHCLADCDAHLVPIGRLDAATSGLLLLTNDTRFGDWVCDPAHGVPRIYLATVRGEVADAEVPRLIAGLEVPLARGHRPAGAGATERLAAHAVTVRKRSRRETHLVLHLREGKNREVRRLLAALGHEVTRLKRAAFGGLDLGGLAPGQWRTVPAGELRTAFPGAPLRQRLGPAGG